ncbi:hypothetical protein [Acidicapsa acidisoli]|uniref:hypothetical protein n=1 Tax=Acidicapsa acidisoli TaxID=1615681 RepID=UPI0021E08848|nr:hypothetical protein [Acidicapsa acidisoli]
MASKQSKAPQEYRFEIDAFTPETIPMERLAQYLSDLARMMGEANGVHLARIAKGSTVPIIRVDWEAEPKVRQRIQEVKFNEGPREAQRAYREINKKLVEDNASGTLLDRSKNQVIRFPGREAANQLEFGPIRQHSTLQGIPIKVGGEKADVPIHLEDGDLNHIVYAPRRIAKQISQYLFTTVVRIEGMGRWFRNRLGEWELRELYAETIHPLSEGNLKGDIARLRAIPADWKQMDDPIGELMALRSGEGSK